MNESQLGQRITTSEVFRNGIALIILNQIQDLFRGLQCNLDCQDYLEEIATVGFAQIAGVDAGRSRMPGRVRHTTVKVPGLDDFVDGLVSANGFEGAQFKSLVTVNLNHGKATNGNAGFAVTSDGILIVAIFSVIRLIN